MRIENQDVVSMMQGLLAEAAALGLLERRAQPKIRRRTLADPLGVAPLALLASCGGGGGASSIPAPPAPSVTAQADAFTVAGDLSAATTGNVLTNDLTVGGSATVATFGRQGSAVVSAGEAVVGSLGTLTINADGSYSFVAATASAAVRGLASGQTAAEVFTYTPTISGVAGAAQTVTVTITGVNDAPAIGAALPAVTVNEGTSTTIVVPDAAFSDPDAGATLTLTAQSADGSALPAFINFDPAARSFSVAPTATSSGTYSIRVTATDAAGANTSQLFTLQVNNVVTGIVADGYIRDATVFIDANGDGQLSAGESSTTTDSNGRFSLVSQARGPTVATGGTNIDTGLANLVKLSAPDGFSAVNPLTTVAQSLVALGNSAATAEQRVETAFGIPAQLDLATLDFIADTSPSSIQAHQGAVKVAQILAAAKNAGGDAAERTVLQRLAETVGNANGVLPLDDALPLRSIFSVAFADAKATELALKVSAMNQTISQFGKTGPEITATQTRLATNLAPIAVNDRGTVDEDSTGLGTLTGGILVLENDSDPNDDRLSIVAINGVITPLGGASVVVDKAVASLSIFDQLSGIKIIPNADFHGELSLTYTTSDGRGGLATATLQVTVRPRPENDAAAVGTTDGAVVSGNVLTNDTDIFGTQYTISQARGVAYPTPEAQAFGTTYGSLVLSGDGSYTYTVDYDRGQTRGLKAGQTAIDSSSYSIRDVNGVDGGSAVLAITVTGINDAPSLASITTTNPLATFSTAPLSGTIAMSDVDGDTATFVGFRNNSGAQGTFGSPLQGDFGTLRITSDRFYTYTPDPDATAYKALAAGQVGTEQFFYTATDGQLTTEATFRRQWVGVNDAPVANNDTGFSVTEDASGNTASGNVRTNDTDPDSGTTLSVVSVGGASANVGHALVGTYGSVVLNSDGSFIYTLDNGDPDTQALNTGQTVTETFIYGISDGSLSAQAELQISIIGLNG